MRHLKVVKQCEIRCFIPSGLNLQSLLTLNRLNPYSAMPLPLESASKRPESNQKQYNAINIGQGTNSLQKTINLYQNPEIHPNPAPGPTSRNLTKITKLETPFTHESIHAKFIKI